MKTIYQTLIALIIFGAVAFAQIPRTISYQGILTDASGYIVQDRNYQLQLALYTNLSAGTPIYIETQTVGVFKGIYNVSIGSITPIPASITFDRVYYLGVSVDGGSELIPRTALTSVPYSLHSSLADVAQSLASGATGVVTSVNNQSGNITLQGAGSTTVTNNGGSTFTISSTGGSGGTGIQGVQNTDGMLNIQNPNGPTATINLSDNAITHQKIASGQVVKSLNNMHDDVTLVAGSNVTLTPNGNAITISATGGSGGKGITEILNSNGTLNVTNGTGPIATLGVADNSIGTAQIANAAVNAQKIAAGVIPSSLPPNGPAFGDLQGTYPGPTIQANAVVSSKIADGAVTAQKLATGLIPNSLPPNGPASGDLSGTYPAPSIAANAVVSSKINDDAVTTAKIADGSVTTSKISSTGAASGSVLQYNGTNIVWGPTGGGPWSTNGTNISNTNTGNVGIGTSSPSHILHLFKPASSLNQIAFGNDEWLVGNVNTSDFSIYRGATQQIYMTSTGKVGIGTTNPTHKLTVANTVAGSWAADVTTSGASTGQSYGLLIDAGTNSSDYSFKSRDQNGTDLFTIRGNNGIAGGYQTSATGNSAFGMGMNCTASGNSSIAMGYYASTAGYSGSCVIADGSNASETHCTAINQFVSRFAGGMYLYSSFNWSTGVSLAPNGVSWGVLCDRNKKENFKAIDGEQLLLKIKNMPITEWNYKNSDSTVRYIGPMAQDFWQAFHLAGTDSLHITTLAIDGVNMAAIKALEQRTTELKIQTAQISALNVEVSSLRKQVALYNDIQVRLAALEAKMLKGQNTLDRSDAQVNRETGATK